MKKILFLLILLSTLSVFGQLDFTELVKISKMDIETYEIHIMDKGYEHDDVEFLYNGNVVETRYVKYDAINESTRYVTHVFSKNVPKSPEIIYTTSDKKELSTFYLQLKDFGLKMFYSEKEDGYLVKKYEKMTEEKWYAERLNGVVETKSPLQLVTRAI